MHRKLVCECVYPLLNNPRYIFIVRRLSILSKLDSNNPYHIWVELYFLNINYLIILDTWSIWPPDARAGVDSQVNRIHILGPSCSRPTFWFGQIMVITVVWILHRVISNLVLRIVGVMCLAHRAFKVFDHPDLGLTWFVVQTILFKCDQSLVCHRA
jgi:hypothetical protein